MRVSNVFLEEPGDFIVSTAQHGDMGGAWAVFPYLFGGKGSGVHTLVFRLRDDKTILQTGSDQCIQEYKAGLVAPGPCSSADSIKWEILNDERLYAFELDMCLYPSREEPKFAMLGYDCGDKSAFIKCKLPKHFTYPVIYC